MSTENEMEEPPTLTSLVDVDVAFSIYLLITRNINTYKMGIEEANRSKADAIYFSVKRSTVDKQRNVVRNEMTVMVEDLIRNQ